MCDKIQLLPPRVPLEASRGVAAITKYYVEKKLYLFNLHLCCKKYRNTFLTNVGTEFTINRMNNK